MVCPSGTDWWSGPSKSYSFMVGGGAVSGYSCEAEIGTAQPPKVAHLLSLGALYGVSVPSLPAAGACATLAPHSPPPPVSSCAKPQPPCAWQPLEPRQVW